MKGNHQNLKKRGLLFLKTLGIVILAGSVLLGGIYLLKNRKQSDEYNSKMTAQTDDKRLDGDTDLIKEEQKILNLDENGNEVVTENTVDWSEISKSESPVSDTDSTPLPEAEVLPPNTYTLETKGQGTVRFVFAGDILFDENYSVMSSYRNRGNDLSKCIAPNVQEIMTGADIMMLNNEFTYTDRGEPLADKAYTFRAKPESVSLLTELGVDIVSVANNHISDFGEISLTDTLDTLEGAGIQYVGAGRDLEEARKIVYYQTDDMKIAVVSATQIERLYTPDTKGATENSPGTFRCFDSKLLEETIAEAKTNSDFVILYIHWGTENTDVPDWLQTDQAPLYAKAGADLIVGTHSHCLQPVTYSGDTPVIYSMGNFWFNSKNLDTCMIEAEIASDGLKSLKMIPCKQSGCTTTLLEGEEAKRVLDYVSGISETVSIAEDGTITKK